MAGLEVATVLSLAPIEYFTIVLMLTSAPDVSGVRINVLDEKLWSIWPAAAHSKGSEHGKYQIQWPVEANITNCMATPGHEDPGWPVEGIDGSHFEHGNRGV